MSDSFVYPGTFDPVTEGHMDIIRRASSLCPHLVVAVLDNDAKRTVFTVEERVHMLELATEDMENVSIRAFSGLTADYMKITGNKTLVRGLRAVSDFDYELQMALLNKSINPNLDTIFLLANQDHLYLSSSVVRDLAKHKADLTGFVPEKIKDIVAEKFDSANKTTV